MVLIARVEEMRNRHVNKNMNLTLRMKPFDQGKKIELLYSYLSSKLNTHKCNYYHRG